MLDSPGVRVLCLLFRHNAGGPPCHLYVVIGGNILYVPTLFSYSIHAVSRLEYFIHCLTTIYSNPNPENFRFLHVTFVMLVVIAYCTSLLFSTAYTQSLASRGDLSSINWHHRSPCTVDRSLLGLHIHGLYNLTPKPYPNSNPNLWELYWNFYCT